MKWCALLLLMLACADAQASWSDWWLNKDQQAQRALDHGDAKRAAQLFNDPRHRAYAESKAGNYADAAKQLVDFNDAQSQYNRGNALAYSGDLKQALTAYDTALKQSPENSSLHSDAQHNRDLVAKQLQQQKQNQSKQGNKGNKNDQNKQGKQNDKDNQHQQGSNSSGSSNSSGNSGNEKDNKDGKKNNNKNGKSNSSSENASNGNKQQGQSGQQSASNNGHSSSSASGAQSSASAQQNARDKAQAQRDVAVAAAQQQREQSGNSSSASSAQGMAGVSQSAANSNSSKGQPAAMDMPKPPTEQSLAEDQWLRQIPDDPAGLVRRKFLIEHWLKQHKAQHENSN